MRLLSILLCAAGLYGQSAPVPGEVAYLEGKVLNAVSKEPLRKARVVLTRGTGPESETAIAVTDSEGVFRFAGLPPGRYSVGASKDGFQGSGGMMAGWGGGGGRGGFMGMAMGGMMGDAGGFGGMRGAPRGESVTLQGGDIKKDLQILLTPFSIVTGVITDDDGDPIVGATVVLLRPTYDGGQRSFNEAGQARTNARGEYRLRIAGSGQFFLGAYTDNGYQAPPRSVVVAGKPQPEEGYGLQLYPGTTQGDQASPIPVAPGREARNINLRLPRVAKGGLNVQLAGLPDGRKTEMIMLQVEPDNALDVGQVNYRVRTGSKTAIQHLFPGTYTLTASFSSDGKDYLGRQKIRVEPGQTIDATLSLVAGAELTGTLAIEGEWPDRPADLQVRLISQEGYQRNPPRTTVKADGKFTFPSVAPGTWDIVLSRMPRGGYVKSMTLSGKDVLTQDMQLTGTAAGPLKIVVSTHGAKVEGDLDLEAAQQSRRWRVMLLPQGKFAGVQTFQRIAQVDEKGHFLLEGVRPGSYRLLALDPMEANLIEAPETAKQIATSGELIELTESASVTKKLKPTLLASVSGK